MLQSCARCGGALRPSAQFCPDCGSPYLESSALAGAVLPAPEPLPPLRLFVDIEAMRHFQVGTRCALRMRVDVMAGAAQSAVGMVAEVASGERLGQSRSVLGPLGSSTILTLWFVPPLAGFDEVRGILYSENAAGARLYAHFAGLQFRVAADSGPRVSVVNIDQSSARVVDNSRTSFAASDTNRGGLVSGGDWHEVPLRLAHEAEISALLDQPLRQPAQVDAHAEAPILAPMSEAPIHFRIVTKAEPGEYEVSGRLSQGELATIYDGRRRHDGARVAVKIADDKADNDLIAAEVSALALLCSEDCPQRKHLPQVIDRFHTRDGRLGTVFEYLDGYDLIEVRRRLPNGLPAQHLIWLLRRCLSVLGWAHSRGVLHGNLDPAHIILRPRDHNVWLVDWCYSIVNPAQSGQGFRCLNELYSPPEVAARKPPLPAADLYSLGKCMLFVLGGDVEKKSLPADLDDRLQRFLKYFMLDSALSRAGDAWEAYRQLDRLREEIFGPHQFLELHL